MRVSVCPGSERVFASFGWKSIVVHHYVGAYSDDHQHLSAQICAGAPGRGASLSGEGPPNLDFDGFKRIADGPSDDRKAVGGADDAVADKL